ncbi:MAG: kynureninase [Acidimicrobiia bacterium]|nr:kynureninase [Acidimicrobiia bacterium]
MTDRDTTLSGQRLEWTTDLDQARALDATDQLAPMRSRFLIPTGPDGGRQVYLVGNSLGLPTTSTRHYVDAELDRWAALGVAGHFTGEQAWAPYHRLLTDQMAMIVGAATEEVVVMNSLTVNLHLLLVSFYRPTPQRHKILIEAHAFPSDHFAVESQIRQRGYDPATSLEVLAPRGGEETLRHADIVAAIERSGSELAVVLLPGVQYYTGQVLPMLDITRAAHAAGALVGFDLAHAAGNIPLDLHDWGVDFAVWCTYKYLNAGPGAVGGCYVHNRHVADRSLPKLLGWWGTRPDTRFEMATTFDPIPTVESWQLSNAPILSMAALRASLDVIDEAGGMTALRYKSERQIAYLDFLLERVLGDRIQSITPRPLAERGAQVALRVTSPGHAGEDVQTKLEQHGVACDWRHPDVIRAAPVPLYNSFEDIHRFVAALDRILR